MEEAQTFNHYLCNHLHNGFFYETCKKRGLFLGWVLILGFDTFFDNSKFLSVAVHLATLHKVVHKTQRRIP